MYLLSHCAVRAAVRVGQRLPSRFGQSGEARELGLVQIFVEGILIRLNRFFHLGKNGSNRFFANFCSGLSRSTPFDGLPRYSRKFKIDAVESYRMTHQHLRFLRFFLGNQTKHWEETGEDFQDLLP